MFVFVYGTLKSGQPNNYLIKDETRGNGTWIGKAKTTEKYPLVVASRYNVPYLLHKPGTGQVIITRPLISLTERNVLSELYV